MNKETTTFTIRTSPEIKNGIEEIIRSIMIEQGINSKGQAFGLLADAFREYKSEEMAPQYKEQLKSIRSLLDTVYSTVLSITNLSTTTLQEKNRDTQAELEKLKKKIRDLEFNNKTLENKALRYEEKIKKLEDQLFTAQQELAEKKKIDTILSKLDSLERSNS